MFRVGEKASVVAREKITDNGQVSAEKHFYRSLLSLRLILVAKIANVVSTVTHPDVVWPFFGLKV